MTDLSRQRCANHRDREAAARCPECRRFYCRECVTEHSGRVICAACLQQKLQPHSPKKPSAWRHTASLSMQAALGFLLLWLFFYTLGQILLRIPSPYHEGSLWRSESHLTMHPQHQRHQDVISTLSFALVNT